MEHRVTANAWVARGIKRNPSPKVVSRGSAMARPISFEIHQDVNDGEIALAMCNAEIPDFIGTSGR